MRYFTLITGIASIISLAIQLLDLFPRFRRQRQAVLLIVFGIFLGSAIRGIDASLMRVDFRLTGLALLVGFIAIAVVGFLITAASTADRIRRMELYGVAGAGAGLLAAILFFGGMMEAGKESAIGLNRERLTISELSALADRAESQGDMDRAISYLEATASRLDPKDENLFKVRERIKELRAKALGYKK
jgi:hypothetical protein